MSNTHTVNESLIPNKPFELMRDFVADRADQLLRPRAGARSRRCRRNSVAELIALAKAKPGRL